MLLIDHHFIAKLPTSKTPTPSAARVNHDPFAFTSAGLGAADFEGGGFDINSVVKASVIAGYVGEETERKKTCFVSGTNSWTALQRVTIMF